MASNVEKRLFSEPNHLIESSQESFPCLCCDRVFSSRKLESKHRLSVHGARKYASSSNASFVCDVCDKRFCSRSGKHLHMKRFHHQSYEKTHIQCVEVQCSIALRTISELRDHLAGAHGIQEANISQSLSFNSMKEFEAWKVEEENRTNTHFIIQSVTKQVNYSTKYYSCNRSGSFKSKSEGKRQLKAQGSVRCGHPCTSQIVAKIFDDHVDAVHYTYHYKHDFRLGYVPLPTSVKEEVAGKLLQGVKDSRILADVRHDSADSGKIQRKHIITIKDVSNIKKSYSVALSSHGSVIGNDGLSVRVMVEKMKNDGMILDYKEQNSQHSVLSDSDFFLAFMTECQKNMLMSFGYDRICIDSTHGTTGYGFELLTLLVLDEFEEGFPVAFCLTSTVNLKNVTYFFECVKTVVPDLKCKVFMSDDAPFLYTAWRTTFGPSTMQLLCAWHVDRAWQRNLLSIPKHKREKVYALLKTITYELNAEKFKIMLDDFVQQLGEDEDTKVFGEYFKKNYCSRVECWAYCHRKDARLNTNMHIENFHKQLKYIYMDGKKSKRVDKCVEKLLDFMRDKSYDRIIKFHKGKITKKHTTAAHRHLEGKKIVSLCSKVSDSEWLFPSTSTDLTHTVKREHLCNANTKCNIVCRECFSCAMSHTCTCSDYNIQRNVCKHIHAAILFAGVQIQYSGSLNSANSFHQNQHFDDDRQNEDAKATALDICNSISSKLAAKTVSENSLLQLTKLLKAAEKVIDSDNFDELSFLSSVRERNNEPVNKKVEAQNRFFSVKKPKPKQKQQMKKPGLKEQAELKTILLGTPFINNDGNDHNYV